MKKSSCKAFFSMFAVAFLLLGFTAAQAAVNLNMYYPVAVGGPITKTIDGMIADFEKANPDIKVKAVYAGNYDDTRVKALAALKAKKDSSIMVAMDMLKQGRADALVTAGHSGAGMAAHLPGVIVGTRSRMVMPSSSSRE